jgi:hypothetical protein
LEKIRHQYKSGEQFIPAIDYKSEEAAMRNLNGNAFKLWRYFLRWYGKGFVYFSPAAIIEELGFGKNGPVEARNELERKGYLQKIADKQNIYTFTPVLPIDYERLKNKSIYSENNVE